MIYISPTLWVIRFAIQFSYKDFSPSRGFLQTNIHSSAGSPLAHGSFPWRKNGKNAYALCDGIGLGMLSKNSPSKRRILKEDIPDNKAFYPCMEARAKSHLKWAEAFTDSSCFFGIRELLRRFGTFALQK